jgi:hypothetical protein
VALGTNVPKALGDFLVLEALYATDGCACLFVGDGVFSSRYCCIGITK